MAKRSRSVWVSGLGLGIGVGVALGTFVLAPNLPGGTFAVASRASSQLEEAELAAAINGAEANAADAYVESIAEAEVAGQLKDRSVIVIATTDAHPEDVTKVRELLRQAGAADSGLLQLTDKFFSQDGADSLKTIVANTLPAGAQLSDAQRDPGTHSGQAVAAALKVDRENNQPFADDAERGVLLNALVQAGFVADGNVGPAQAAVIITGDNSGAGDGLFVAKALANFAVAVDQAGLPTTLAGRISTATDTGPIGLVRVMPQAKLEVSTVDSVDRAYGQLATVISTRDQLLDKAGSYGAASSADAAAPAVHPIQ